MLVAYGGDIMGELATKREFVTLKADYPKTAIQRQLAYEAMVHTQQQNNWTIVKYYTPHSKLLTN